MALLFLSFIFAANQWLFIGDSLTEGYGISKSSSYPNLIEKKWNSEHPKNKIRIINAGQSGATSASGMAQLKFHAKKGISHLFIALGANDGLRGQSTENLKTNLDKMIRYAKKNGIKVTLLGIKVPQNYGKEYTAKFEKLYKDLAKQHKILLYPFLLEGVAGEKEYNLKDGIHPNEEGYKVIANKLYDFLKENL